MGCFSLLLLPPIQSILLQELLREYYISLYIPPPQKKKKKNHLNPELKGHLPQIGLGMSDVGLDAALLGLGFKGILYYVI